MTGQRPARWDLVVDPCAPLRHAVWMRLRVFFTARLLTCLALGVVPGCGSDDAAQSPGISGDASLDIASETAKQDASGDPAVAPDSPDATIDKDGAVDGATDGNPGVDGGDASFVDHGTPEASCQTDLIVLAKAGTTSSCSFPLPASVDPDKVNLIMGGRLCEQGSNNCNPIGGWFWFGDEVALCDETCLAWENSGSNLLLEVGCPTESCYQPCSGAGGVCGNGINNCCVGTKCSSGTCKACTHGGASCASTSDCCSGSCQGSICVGGMGSPCVSNAGCSEGVCRDNVCQCEIDQILCSSGCVAYLDPNNCRGCGNVCAAGRICTDQGCVCDPQTGLPDECSGVCVNKSNDRNNCGFCGYICPKLEQECVSSVCGCPVGLTDCNGNCVDTNTSQFHCGTCNHGCPPGVEACTAGTCDCVAGYTRCSGNCVNLLTNKFNCNACGNACPGNKTCSNGVCG